MNFGDLLGDPLSFVRKEFERNGNVNLSHIEKTYHDICQDPIRVMKIPSLNKFPISELLSGRLVHLRCMVQDMYDFEFFFRVYNIHNKVTGANHLRCGLYQDVVQCDDNEEFDFHSPSNEHMERQIFYCIPIPGESAWSKQAQNSKFASNDKMVKLFETSTNSYKRKSDEDEEEEDEDEEETTETSIDGQEKDCDVEMVDDRMAKKMKSGKDENSNATSYSYKEIFPLPNEKGYPVIVKVYDKETKIELNDLLDIFGVLSLDSQLADHSNSNDDISMDVLERQARNPHPQIVPRIHALVVKKLESDHPFHLTEIIDEMKRSLENCRIQILTVFQHCFHGDELLAEYLLCHLLSSVYSRRDVTILGKFSLNISDLPASSTFINEFYEILSKILNKCHLLPMTLENMNKLDLVPCKDYDENRLKSGILQLSGRSHLIIDETLLQPGKLEELGVLNVAALSSVVERQELNYNFKYHSQIYPTNIRVLVLSEGKSILKCDCHIPLVPSHLQQGHSLENIRGLFVPYILTYLRAYLCYTENLASSLPSEVQEDIEKDFVESRRCNPDGMTPEDLHTSLTLARYVALSHGSDTLHFDHWLHARKMERLRKQRFK